MPDNQKKPPKKGAQKPDKLTPGDTKDAAVADGSLLAFGLGDERSVAGKVEADFRESLSMMQTRHNEWKEYDEFYLANQWKGRRADWKFSPVVNYVSYIVDTKVPQITQTLPTPMFLPTAKDDEDAAHAFSMVAGVITDRNDFTDDVVPEVVQTGLLLGTAWMKVRWDESLSGGSVKAKNLWKGDVVIEAVEPSNIFVDPNATCVEDCRYIIYAAPKRLSWFKETFNVVVDEQRNGYNTTTEFYNRPGMNKDMKGRAMLFEYWWRENGKVNVIYCAGGKVLKKIEDVYAHGDYPFIPFVPKPERKSIFGIGEPRNIIENQKLINKLLEIQANNALLTSNPIALVSSDSGINPMAWTTMPGRVQTVKDINNAIRWLEPPRISSDVPALIESLVNFNEKIGGVFDSATGETPGAVTAAAAIQLLQERASLPIKGIQRALFSAVKEVYEQVIELVKQFYTETRYFRIDGDDGQIEFMEFRAAQHSDIDLDVKISVNSGTATSQAFVSQLGKDLFDMKLLTGSQYVEMLDGLPNKDKIVEYLKQQEEAAANQPPAPPMDPNAQPPVDPMMQQQMPMQPPMPQQAPPQQGADPASHLQMIMQAPDTPPQIKQMVQDMAQKGAPPDAILQQILQAANG